MRARLGQNFLVAPAWQRRIAAAVAAQPGDLILEIGGGPGDISALLAAGGCRLIVVELDSILAERLRRRFAGQANVTVVEADILTLDLQALLGAPASRRRVFGNLPYYITSPILFHLFRVADQLTDATVMMQKEVAARVTAEPGSPAFGLLSASCQLFSRPRRLFDLPAGAFRPRPEVTSTLVRLDFMTPLTAQAGATEKFLAFLRACFAQKRKRLANNLKPLAAAERITAAFAALPLAPNVRAEECGVETLWRLWRQLGDA